MMAATVGAFGRAWRPLVFYYGIAVAVPVLNGATLDREFLEHVAFVVAVPLAIVMAATGSNWLLRRERGGPHHELEGGAAGAPGDGGGTWGVTGMGTNTRLKETPGRTP